MEVTDRRNRVIANADFSGFDFVSVDENDPRRLFVHLLGAPPAASVAPPSGLRIETDEAGKPVSIVSSEIVLLDGEEVIEVVVDDIGANVPHRIVGQMAWLDRCFTSVPFSFHVHCDRGSDCASFTPPEDVSAATYLPSYRGRDFDSLLQEVAQLLAVRYPDRAQLHPADFRTVFAELVSALGDQFTLFQDRIFRERFIESAVEPRSIESLAALVDYFREPSQVERVLVSVSVDVATQIHAGDRLRQVRDGVNEERLTPDDVVLFEVGRSLDEIERRQTYDVVPILNALEPYFWDDSKTTFGTGATELSVSGDLSAAFTFNAPGSEVPSGRPGRWVAVIGEGTACDTRRLALRIVDLEVVTDPMNAGAPVTILRWEDPLEEKFEGRNSVVHANIVHAMSGLTQTVYAFDGDDPIELAKVVRTNGRVVDGERRAAKRFSLPGTDALELNFDAGEPQVAVSTYRWRSDDPAEVEAEIAHAGTLEDRWTFTRSFVGTHSSTSRNWHYTIESGTWGTLYEKWTPSGRFTSNGYVGAPGKTVRFGDGEFGRSLPNRSLIRLAYRVGTGEHFRVALGALSEWLPASDDVLSPPRPRHVRVSNVAVLQRGRVAEALEHVRAAAPYTFSRVARRAVRPEDYAKFATDREDVQRAGCAFRWTGSYTEAFVTADPLNANRLEPELADDIRSELNVVRQVARPVNVVGPRYANLDLRAVLCIDQGAVRSEVESTIDDALFRSGGFFDPNRWTFGDPLYRSEIEACLQGVPGVNAVLEMYVEVPGLFGRRTFDEEKLRLGHDVVIRVSRTRPGWGSFRAFLRGGR